MKNAITLLIDGNKIEVRLPDHLLRDWFAGQALNGILYGVDAPSETKIAQLAYRMADGMMAARRP